MRMLLQVPRSQYFCQGWEILERTSLSSRKCFMIRIVCSHRQTACDARALQTT
jgi:hypothetical protein